MYTTAVVRAAVVRAAVVHAAVVRAYDGCCSCIRRLLFVHTTAVVRAYDGPRLSFVHTTWTRLGVRMNNSYRSFRQGPRWYDMAYTCMNEKSFVHMTGLGVEYAVVAAMYIF